MIAIAPTVRSTQVSPQAAELFESMLPSIRRVACYRFRHVPIWYRKDLINDVVALAFVAFARLVERGKAALAYPTVLANYAVRQVRDGRQVGASQNVNEVLSKYAQQQRGFSVESLLEPSADAEWEELTDDRRADPGDIAALRVDFRSWLGRLERFKRRVALRLARGDTTSDAARHFKLSPARVSQIRAELHADWDEFQALPAAA
jgi:hypothetical protein